MGEVLKALQKYNPILKGIILLAVLLFIYFKILSQLEGPGFDLVEFFSSVGDRIYLVLAALVLMPLNWSFEAVKWKWIIQEVEQVSFRQSLAGVLSGLSLGFITPHAIGDYAGRVWQLRTSRRFRTIGGLLLGRIMQFAVTLLFGLVGLMLTPIPTRNWEPLILTYVGGIIMVFLVIIYPSLFLKLFEISFLKSLRVYFKLLDSYSLGRKLQIFWLSLLRYMVFAVQFVLLMLACSVEADLAVLFSGATFIFLAKSALPTFNFLSDLGVREAAAAFYFSVLEVPVVEVVMASLILWIINILLPALAGTAFLWSIKIFNSKE